MGGNDGAIACVGVAPTGGGAPITEFPANEIPAVIEGAVIDELVSKLLLVFANVVGSWPIIVGVGAVTGPGPGAATDE